MAQMVRDLTRELDKEQQHVNLKKQSALYILLVVILPHLQTVEIIQETEEVDVPVPVLEEQEVLGLLLLGLIKQPNNAKKYACSLDVVAIYGI